MCKTVNVLCIVYWQQKLSPTAAKLFDIHYRKNALMNLLWFLRSFFAWCPCSLVALNAANTRRVSFRRMSDTSSFNTVECHWNVGQAAFEEHWEHIQSYISQLWMPLSGVQIPYLTAILLHWCAIETVPINID